jgi:ABC-type uncharacterized transport system permease subunit
MKHPFINLTLNSIAVGVALSIFAGGLIGIGIVALIGDRLRRHRRAEHRQVTGVTLLQQRIAQASPNQLREIALHISLHQGYNRTDRLELTSALRLRHLELEGA